MKKALAAGAGKRRKKKDERKRKILAFITSKQSPTTTDLLSLMGEKINRTTLYELIKELEREELIYKNGLNWMQRQTKKTQRSQNADQRN